MNIIDIHQVSFSYTDQPVLQNIDLKVKPGEFLGIIGPNGSGKSTLLKLMLGLLHPQQGSIHILQQPPAKVCHRIGYVPQFTTFAHNFPISVEDMVLQGRLRGCRPGLRFGRKDRQLALAALEQTQTTDLRHRCLSRLSGGQKQRVLIARTLASQPELLLLDEPTANIDPRVEEDLFTLLKRLNQHLTIIVVSHDVGFISHYIQRVACLNKTLVCHPTSALSGQMISELYGTPVHLIQHQKHMDARGD